MKLLLIVALQSAAALANGGTPTWEIGSSWLCDVQTERACERGKSACPLEANGGTITIDFATGRLGTSGKVFLPTIYVSSREFFGDHFAMGASKLHFTNGAEMWMRPATLNSEVFDFILTDTDIETQRSYAGTCRSKLTMPPVIGGK